MKAISSRSNGFLAGGQAPAALLHLFGRQPEISG